MWNFLLGLRFARTRGVAHLLRPLLALTLCGALLAGLVYALVVFHAVEERSHASHVRAYNSN
jgi:hypothetical protein